MKCPQRSHPAWNKGLRKPTRPEVRSLILVDPQDKHLLDGYAWNIDPANGYARANVGGRSGKLHQLILETPRGLFIDHINGNKLDNRRANLRLATRTQNGQNRKLNKNNKSGYKGVTWHKHKNKWSANIRINGKLKYLGDFQDPKEAAVIYNQFATEHFGEYARLNEVAI